jgi:hypothetical protein
LIDRVSRIIGYFRIGLFDYVLAISDADRARAYNDRHPDRRKVLDQIAFAFHFERKQEENSSEKKFIFKPIVSMTKPQVQGVENDQIQE